MMDNYEVLVKLSKVNALKNHNIGWIHESGVKVFAEKI